MTDNVVGHDCERVEDERMAGEILQTLCGHYPGHDWFVLIRGGIVQIKNQSWSSEWGMAIHYTDIAGDAKVRSQKVKIAAGEFLERAHMRRGAKTEERLSVIEGIPDRYVQRARILGA
jgi:hypothetical protein